MPKTWRVPTNDGSLCPHCQRDLSFVASWTFRGLWGYNEVRTFECPEHGPDFCQPANDSRAWSRQTTRQRPRQR